MWHVYKRLKDNVKRLKKCREKNRVNTWSVWSLIVHFLVESDMRIHPVFKGG